MHKKILIAGQADHDNFGDSLIFSMYLKLIREASPESTVKVLNPTKLFTARLNEDDEFISSAALKQNGSIDYEADFIILVPGGFLGCPDITDPFWQLKWLRNSYIKSILESITEAAKPTLVHGVEIGPFLRPLTSKPISNFLNSSSINKIFSRNYDGANYAKKHLKVHAAVLPDFVSSMTCFYPNISADKDLYQLGIHATGKIFANNLLAKKFLSDIVSCIIKTKIKSILIFSDQTIPDKHNGPIKQLCLRLSEIGVQYEVRDYYGIKSTLKNISNCSTIITSKLHVGVCGLSYSKKVISISSHPKLFRFYSDCGLKPFNINYFLSNSNSKRDLICRVLEMNAKQYFNEYNLDSHKTHLAYHASLSEFLKHE